MLHVYGKQINLQYNTDKDLHLYLDLGSLQLSSVMLTPKETSYVVSVRPYMKLLPVIEQGYYNVVSVPDVTMITETFLTNFLATDYEDNRLKISSIILSIEYTQHKDTATAAAKLLTAIRDNDYDTYYSVAKLNLGNIIDALADIPKLIKFSDELKATALSFDTMRQKIGSVLKLEEKLQQYEQSISTVTEELSNECATNQQLKSQLIALQSDTSVSDELASAKQQLLKLQQEHTKLKLDYNTAKLKLSRLQVEKDVSDEDLSSDAKMIKRLTMQLDKIRNASADVVLAESLPIINNSTAITLSKILYLKEVRTAVYMNSLIAWLLKYISVKHYNGLILVYDPLYNQFDRRKYESRGWKINTIIDNHLMIINNLSLQYLRDTVNLNDFDKVIVIDRLHVEKDIFEHGCVSKYYLVNTINDPEEYNLPPDRCVCFSSPIQTADDRVPKYFMTPGDATLTVTATDKRMYKIKQDGVFPSILDAEGFNSEK